MDQEVLKNLAIENAFRLIKALEQIEDWQFVDDLIAAIRDCDASALMEMLDTYGLTH